MPSISNVGMAGTCRHSTTLRNCSIIASINGHRSTGWMEGCSPVKSMATASSFPPQGTSMMARLSTKTVGVITGLTRRATTTIWHTPCSFSPATHTPATAIATACNRCVLLEKSVQCHRGKFNYCLGSCVLSLLKPNGTIEKGCWSYINVDDGFWGNSPIFSLITSSL